MEGPPNHPRTFGDEMRRMRESAGLSLQDIVNETKISKQILVKPRERRFPVPSAEGLLPEFRLAIRVSRRCRSRDRWSRDSKVRGSDSSSPLDPTRTRRLKNRPSPDRSDGDSGFRFLRPPRFWSLRHWLSGVVPRAETQFGPGVHGADQETQRTRLSAPVDN